MDDLPDPSETDYETWVDRRVDEVSTAALLEALQNARGGERYEVAAGLAMLAIDRPDRLLPHVDELYELFRGYLRESAELDPEDLEYGVAYQLAKVLGNVARVDGALLSRLADDLDAATGTAARLLLSAVYHTGRSALQVESLDAEPAAYDQYEPLVEPVIDWLDEDQYELRALQALQSLAYRRPSRVAEPLPTVVDALGDPELGPAAAGVIRSLAAASPSALEPHVPDVRRQFERASPHGAGIERLLGACQTLVEQHDRPDLVEPLEPTLHSIARDRDDGFDQLATIVLDALDDAS